jgi:hypothetical protein
MATRSRRSSSTSSKTTKKKITTKSDERTVDGIDIAKVQATIDDLSSSFWTPPEGRSRVRILPPQAAFEGDFVFRQDVHYGFEDESGKGRAVACLRAFDEDCPVCEFVEYLQCSADKEDEKLARDMRRQAQLITECLIRPAKRVRLWRIPISVYREIAGWLPDPDIGDVTHPTRGRDIILKRKGTGLRTRYSVTTADRSKIGSTSWKKGRNDFTRFAAPHLSYKKLHSMLRKQYGWE